MIDTEHLVFVGHTILLEYAQWDRKGHNNIAVFSLLDFFLLHQYVLLRALDYQVQYPRPWGMPPVTCLCFLSDTL
jgi:hypothetical protein